MSESDYLDGLQKAIDIARDFADECLRDGDKGGLECAEAIANAIEEYAEDAADDGDGDFEVTLTISLTDADAVVRLPSGTGTETEK